MRALMLIAALGLCASLKGAADRGGGDSPKIVFLIGEAEYRTAETLPAFAKAQLGERYRYEFVQAGEDDKNVFEGIDEALSDADLLFISVRRRTPPNEQMAAIEAFIKAGKPVIGIRTASHAFSLRGKPPAEGHRVWERFDPEVFGGSYRGHHGNKLKTGARVVAAGHAVVAGLSRDEFPTGGSLYQVLPLAEGAEVLLEGRAESIEQRQPVAWTFTNAFGGRSFYTSLGHIDDFERPEFRTLLVNAIAWAMDDSKEDGAATLRVPGLWEEQGQGRWASLDGEVWFAARVQVPADWPRDGVALEVESVDNASEVWFAGERVTLSIEA